MNTYCVHIENGFMWIDTKHTVFTEQHFKVVEQTIAPHFSPSSRKFCRYLLEINWRTHSFFFHLLQKYLLNEVWVFTSIDKAHPIPSWENYFLRFVQLNMMFGRIQQKMYTILFSNHDYNLVNHVHILDLSRFSLEWKILNSTKSFAFATKWMGIECELGPQNYAIYRFIYQWWCITFVSFFIIFVVSLKVSYRIIIFMSSTNNFNRIFLHFFRISTIVAHSISSASIIHSTAYKGKSIRKQYLILFHP